MNYMDPNLHPFELDEINMLMNVFLEDVLFEYRENEIKEWLFGLTLDDVETILNRPNNEELRKNSFVIPFIFLKYQVVPPSHLIEPLRHYLHNHPLLPNENIVLKKTKENFTRIFTGKPEFTSQF
jgi:hypothetical protein